MKIEKNYSNKELITLLSTLVSIDSVFPNEHRLALFIEEYLMQANFEVRRIPVKAGRDNIVAIFGKSENYICLYGHMDTVPADSEWQQNPFVVKYKGDRGVGLGVADMKGGLACILQAATFASENGFALKVVFGVDEENISLGSFVLTKTNFFDNVGFLISAESGQIFNETQDFSLNYGRKGRFVVEAEINGLIAHAARSDLGVNAILQTSRLLTQLESLKFREHPVLGGTEIVPFYINSSTNSFSIPAHTKILLNVLSIPGVSYVDVLHQLELLSNKIGVKANFKLVPRETPYMDAYEVNLNNSFIKKLETDVWSLYKVEPTYSISVADENRFSNDLNIPVISVGPIGGNDHSANEWVMISSLEKVLSAYKKIIKLYSKT